MTRSLFFLAELKTKAESRFGKARSARRDRWAATVPAQFHLGAFPAGFLSGGAFHLLSAGGETLGRTRFHNCVVGTNSIADASSDGRMLR
jgi:hypothetical protein